jgi:ATP-dependent DNA helicase DinG
VPGVPAVSGSPVLKNAVAGVFAEGGPLARVLPEYEPRPGQRAMSAAVADAFEHGLVLLAEAGTGTGKTLAYLVPAVLSRHRVLVSTGTKNLQEQILQKDLPLVERALGLRVTATCMKGRANYLCLHRFETYRETLAPHAQPDRVYLTLIEEWAAHTETGDRAEIDELPEDLPLWSEISAAAEHCLGAECPRFADCYVTRMRQRAAESDLVIVNHHLLCADAAVRHHSFGEVIPECAHAVIDEAHQLEDVATQYFGITVSNYRLDELVRDGGRLIMAKAIMDRGRAGDLRDALSLVDTHARALFAELQWKRPGIGARPPVNVGLFDERLRLTEESLDNFGEAGRKTIDALDGLQATVALFKDANEDVRALGRRAGELRDALRFLMRAGDEDFVYFLEIRGRGVFLRATPIDVSSIVRELLLERFRATVLTSATLAVQGTFDYARSRLGIQRSAEIQVPSEFDYSRQAILYLPRGMPDPRSPEFAPAAAREVVEILRRTEGRAFVLFTSYAILRHVQQHVRDQLPYPALVQGEAPRSILLERFKSTPNCVLFATSSFWQGVDVAGEALSCVIIDKLPFASPGDPIVQARVEAVARTGADPFATFQVPLAILTLLQGIGRLLRHRNDRGVLAILDPRLSSMGYGRRFLADLPPVPVTRDLDEVARFFGT